MFLNFTEFEKSRRKYEENMPTAEAEKQVNSIVFNETAITLLGLESRGPEEYLQHAAVGCWYGVDQQTA